MSNPEPETSIIARILASGFNRHIHDHGPDADYASEATESGDGHGFVVSRKDVPYAVRVEQLPALSTTAPMTPGQCWAALKTDLTNALAEHQALVEAGYEPVSPAATVLAYRYALDKMRELETDR